VLPQHSSSLSAALNTVVISFPSLVPSLKIANTSNPTDEVVDVEPSLHDRLMIEPYGRGKYLLSSLKLICIT